jgi:hypothetical protein
MSTIQINSTFCKDKCSNNYITKKELSTLLIIDSIRQFIINQYTFIFKVAPHENILESLVNGYILFNQHKNKTMLASKDNLIKYFNNDDISVEEKLYFTDIILYIQKPKFITKNEIENLRALGELKIIKNNKH